MRRRPPWISRPSLSYIYLSNYYEASKGSQAFSLWEIASLLGQASCVGEDINPAGLFPLQFEFQLPRRPSFSFSFFIFIATTSFLERVTTRFPCFCQLGKNYLFAGVSVIMQNGLNLLQRELNIQPQSSGHKNSKEGAVMPMYSFMIQLIAAFREYLAADFHYTWAEYLICNRRQQTVHLVKSWVMHSRHSLEALLLSSLLLTSDGKKCKLYLRLRKYILQLTNASVLDEIVLRHEDVITIVHRMFPGSLKKEIMNGVKQIFISYKVSDAKIYACVFIEYILSIYDSIDEAQQSFMVGETKSNVILSNFSTISKFSSNLCRDNGLYRRVEPNENSYTVIETKFLPQQLEKQKTKFQQDAHGNQYYSNSINFSSESSLPQHYEKENSQQSLNFSVQQQERTSKAGGGEREEHEIKIEEEEEEVPSKRCFNESSGFSRRSISKQIEEVLIRNEAFKSRLLSGKTSVKMELSHEEEDSINETINIIHSSIVRNRRQHM